ncbi:hypothetical protein GPJ56_007206 [Histomonas meleagridis]|nr:hypothetical protein GPJ56_007206 [Histomonas meleagridis]
MLPHHLGLHRHWVSPPRATPEASRSGSPLPGSHCLILPGSSCLDHLCLVVHAPVPPLRPPLVPHCLVPRTWVPRTGCHHTWPPHPPEPHLPESLPTWVLPAWSHHLAWFLPHLPGSCRLGLTCLGACLSVPACPHGSTTT